MKDPEIPVDVLEAILSRADPADLSRFCRVSKTIYPYAKDALYRDLHLTGRNVLKACLKLTSDADLARRVQTFILFDNTVQVHLGVIQDALLLLPQLRTLILHIGYFGSWILPPGSKCPFQLQTFRCGFLYDFSTAAFLEGQKLLKILAVNSVNSGVEEFRPSCCPSPFSYPSLSTVIAPLSVLQNIVPGRPIRTVTTSSNEGEADAELLDCLVHSTAEHGIQRLMIDYKYIRTVGGGKLGLVVPHLSYLTIDADDINPGHPRTLAVLADCLEEVLSLLQPLKCLAIRFHPTLSTVPCRSIDFSDVITRAFEASSRLRFVIITFYGLRAKYVCKHIAGHEWFICDD